METNVGVEAFSKLIVKTNSDATNEDTKTLSQKQPTSLHVPPCGVLRHYYDYVLAGFNLRFIQFFSRQNLQKVSYLIGL